MKSLAQRTLPMIIAGSALLIASPAFAWTYYVFHDQYAYPFTGSTASEATQNCQNWAIRANKNPSACGAPIAR